MHECQGMVDLGPAITADRPVAREVEGRRELRDKQVFGAQKHSPAASAKAVPLNSREEQQLLHSVHLADGAGQLVLHWYHFVSGVRKEEAREEEATVS